MNILVKTVKASQLPKDWQTELGLSGDAHVRVAIEEVQQARSPETVDRMLERMRNLKPLHVEGDITEFIRAERERIDGRNLR